MLKEYVSVLINTDLQQFFFLGIFVDGNLNFLRRLDRLETNYHFKFKYTSELQMEF
jgi:hypothetical protein